VESRADIAYAAALGCPFGLAEENPVLDSQSSRTPTVVLDASPVYAAVYAGFAQFEQVLAAARAASARAPD